MLHRLCRIDRALLRFTTHRSTPSCKLPLPQVFKRKTSGLAAHPQSTGPTYQSIHHRLFSVGDTRGFFETKRIKDAAAQGKPVDVHDIIQMPAPIGYDVTIADIHTVTLRTIIASDTGIDYLAIPSAGERGKITEATGYIYGPGRRAIMPLVVTKGDMSCWVFFLLDSGSPNTYLNKDACEALGIRSGHAPMAEIGGHPIPVQESPDGCHFTELNLLGTDFAEAHEAFVGYDYSKGRVSLLLGDEVELARVAQ